MERSEIAPVIIGKLINIGGMLRKDADQILQPFNLNQQQFSILFSIGLEGRVNQKNMVTKMVLEKAHVSKVVKKLHKMDLISIEPSSEDKRSSWLSLTSRGEKVLRECRTSIAAWNEEWTAEMDIDQLHLLLDSLTLFQGVLREKSGRS